ncbi:MAG: hypothetical protein ABIZ34_01045 [Candidatus Limnocylindrales bacterium]
MSSRLNLKYGLVAEHDRLSSSADSLSVTEPATGSKSRTKGNLYLIVSSSAVGGRARDATALVADTIRREYYYDESAGIPICLEKAFRSAERRLRGKGGNGIEPGSVGVALAIIRGTELYVATTGPAEAYLVRAARLLMPEHDRGPGLPTADGIKLDVWRGEFAVGDSLLLVARDLTEVVGTEELKNAVVTLHPQSAVEHLHHLYVAAGGEGSDAVLAIEASELGAPRNPNRLVPVATPEELRPTSEDLLEDDRPLVTMGDRASTARNKVGNAIGGVTDRLGDLIPGRRKQYRRITPQVSRRESQRRAAIAFLAFLTVVLALVLFLRFVPRGSESPPVEQVTSGDAALLEARNLTDTVENDDLIVSAPERALDLLRKAWADLKIAEEKGIPAADITPERARVSTGLDSLYGTQHLRATIVASLSSGDQPPDPEDMVLGPDGVAYVVDRSDAARNIQRVDPETGARVVVVRPGDGGGEGIGTPRLLAVGGPDLFIIDIRGNLWRWRPSDSTGRGTLGQINVAGDVEWGTRIIDFGTFPQATGGELYNLYVVDPDGQQILKYQPTLDGSGYLEPTNYLSTDNEDVASFRQLYIDGSLFALTGDNVIRHVAGQVRPYELDTPPDEPDLRPGHEYLAFDGTGVQDTGRLYVWDTSHARLLIYDKSDGAFLEQWVAAPGTDLSDVRGFYVVEDDVTPDPSPTGITTPPTTPPTVVWLTSDSVMQSQLVNIAPEPTATPTPSVEPTNDASDSPTVTPSDGSPAPTCRPNGRPPGCVEATPSPSPIP